MKTLTTTLLLILACTAGTKAQSLKIYCTAQYGTARQTLISGQWSVNETDQTITINRSDDKLQTIINKSDASVVLAVDRLGNLHIITNNTQPAQNATALRSWGDPDLATPATEQNTGIARTR